ncbi:hypothetical protein HanIR_Chr17g0874701 [Helianthus annuus]|nr:hypothetical protein HanIR_Chr17g0874701 [Helianthus annuus]
MDRKNERSNINQVKRIKLLKEVKFLHPKNLTFNIYVSFHKFLVSELKVIRINLAVLGC